MSTTEQALRAKVARTDFSDPARFARMIIGDQLWAKQLDIHAAVRDHRLVAVKACHASSKSFTAAEIFWWWLSRWPDAVVLTFASTFSQVKNILWEEVHQVLERTRRLQGGMRLPPTARINDTEIRIAKGNYALGLSPEAGVSIHGYHAAHTLIILDEAPGISGEVHRAIEGARASGQVHLLMLGNPDIPSGPFYDAFTSGRGLWHTITIDAFDTPNLRGLTEAEFDNLPDGMPENDPFFAVNPTPYLVGRRWVYEIAKKYGTKSAIWQSKVRGQFPDEAEDALIPLRWLENARKVPKGYIDGEVLYAGVDVAEEGGDETVCIVRNARRILAMGAWAGHETRGDVAAMLAPYKKRLREVNIDTAGVGAYFAHHFEDLGYNVNGVNVGRATDYPDRFANLKAQLYWSLRERFQDGAVHGLEDDLSISQLASIRYELTPRGLIAIEKKESMAKRGVKSPDRAEALMLAFADRTPSLLRWYEDRGLAAQAADGAARNASPQPPTADAPEEEGGELMKIYLEELKRIEEERNKK